MDYDATDIAATCDRGSDHAPEFLDLLMNVVASHVKDQRIKMVMDLSATRVAGESIKPGVERSATPGS